jgi:hypothetical protein
MIPLLWLLLAILASPFKLKCPLEVENVALRHQVMVLRCSAELHLSLPKIISGRSDDAIRKGLAL